MYQYLFFNYNKYTTLTQDVNNTGNCVWGRKGYATGELCTICSVFCKSKTIVKKLGMGKEATGTGKPGSKLLFFQLKRS